MQGPVIGYQINTTYQSFGTSKEVTLPVVIQADQERTLVSIWSISNLGPSQQPTKLQIYLTTGM